MKHELYRSSPTRMASRPVILTVTAMISLLAATDASAGLPNPFKKKKAPTSVPGAAELRTAEMQASDLFSSASADEAAGREGAALNGYKKLVQSYPYTSFAPTAQFRIAAGLEKNGSYKKAFEAYQELLTNYRQTAQFAEAVDRQFGIARLSRTEKTSSVFGIKKKMDPAEIIEMLQTVVTNAPQGPHAPEAQMEIARIHEEEMSPDLAIEAYRKVVDEYPKSSFAAEAQTKVGENYISKVKDGSRDMSNVDKARDATEEAASLFPTDGMGDLSGITGTKGAIDDAASEAAFTTGKFYEKKGNFRAAMMYYADVLRAPGSSHFEEVRERVAAMTANDPKLMGSLKGASISQADLAVQAPADLKSKAEYFGPPAPVAKNSTVIRRPRMRPGDLIPITPLEPELPGSGSPGTAPDSSLLDPTLPMDNTPTTEPLNPAPELPPATDAPMTEPALPTPPVEPMPEIPAAPEPAPAAEPAPAPAAPEPAPTPAAPDAPMPEPAAPEVPEAPDAPAIPAPAPSGN